MSRVALTPAMQFAAAMQPATRIATAQAAVRVQDGRLRPHPARTAAETRHFHINRTDDAPFGAFD